MQTHLFIPFAIGLVRILITFVFGHCDRLSTTSCSSVFFLESTVCVCVCVRVPSCVWLFVTLWTVAHRLLCPWDFPGQNTGVSWHFLVQGTFLTHGLNLCLLPFQHWQAVSLPLHRLGSPTLLYYCTLLTNQSNFSKWHFFFWSWIQLFPRCSIGKFQMF